MSFTRRRLLGMASAGLTGLGAGAVAGGLGKVAGALTPGDSGGGTGTGARSMPSRIVASRESSCVAEPLKPAQGFPSAQQLPLVGFPPGVRLRPGDLVTVTDFFPEHPWAAAPLTSFVKTTPVRRPDSTFEVGGRITVESSNIEPTKEAALTKAAANRAQVSVSFNDTELSQVLVLDVRPLTTPA